MSRVDPWSSRALGEAFAPEQETKKAWKSRLSESCMEARLRSGCAMVEGSAAQHVQGKGHANQTVDLKCIRGGVLLAAGKYEEQRCYVRLSWQWRR